MYKTHGYSALCLEGHEQTAEMDRAYARVERRRALAAAAAERGDWDRAATYRDGAEKALSRWHDMYSARVGELYHAD